MLIVLFYVIIALIINVNRVGTSDESTGIEGKLQWTSAERLHVALLQQP
jgi:hypothetical protein